MITYIAVSFSVPVTRETVLRMARRVVKYLPDEIAEEDICLYSAGNNRAYLIFWRKANEFGDIVHSEGEVIHLVQGYTTLIDCHDSKQLSESINGSDFFDSPGGIYTLLTVSKATGKITAVQSKSGVTAVFCSKKDGFSVVSDRPILAHMFGQERILLDNSYIPSVAQSVYSINGNTPFLNVFKVSNFDLIEISNSIVELKKRGFFSPPSIPLCEKERVDGFKNVLRTSLPKRFSESQPTLRISGGRDSRLLLAMFADLGINSTIENQNLPHTSEGQLASRVAELAGYKMELSFPTLSEDIDYCFFNSTMRRGGLLNPVPLHYPYENTIVKVGKPIVLGHAHHPRGGFARTMQATRDSVEKRLLDVFAKPFVKKNFDRNTEVIAKYMKKWDAIHPLHILYHSYSELRIPFYLSPHYLEYQSLSSPVYPLVDERVILFLDALLSQEHGAYQLVGETLVFSTIKSFSKELANVPLDGKRWRFEVSMPRAGLESGFQERGQYPLPRPMQVWEKEFVDSYTKKARSVNAKVFGTVRDNADFFEGYLNEDAISLIKSAQLEKELTFALYGVFLMYTSSTYALGALHR